METTRLAHLVALRCPFCHDEVAEADVVVCRECLAKHHHACWRELDACASCRATEGLVALSSTSSRPRARASAPEKAPSTGARTRPEARIVGWVELGAKLAELRQHREKCIFRSPWCLLIPHFWVPFFWPVIFFALITEKSKAGNLSAEIRRVARVHDLDLARDHPEALAAVEDAEGWASRWLF